MKGREDHNADMPMAGVLLVIIGIVIVVSSVLFVPIKTAEVDESRSAPSSEELREVDLAFKQNLGSVEIIFVEPSDAPVIMTIEGTARQSLSASGDPLKIAWFWEIEGDRLVIDAQVDVSSFGTSYAGDDPKTIISISKELRTNLNLDGGIGAFKLTAGEGVVLGKVQIDQSVGSTQVVLDNCALEGDINIITSTGSNQLEWTNLKVEQSVLVNIESTTGGLELEMVQTDWMGGNVTVSASATTGGLDLSLSLKGETSARVSSDTTFGGIFATTKMGFSGSDELLTSDNYPSDHRIDLTLQTTLGGVSLGLEYQA